MSDNIKISYRRSILILAVAAMLFAGIIYAWSILKVPLSADFGWGAEQLALNYTLTMCFFCIGGLLGSFLSRKIGVKLSTAFSAVLAGGGIALTGLLGGNNIFLLYPGFINYCCTYIFYCFCCFIFFIFKHFFM